MGNKLTNAGDLRAVEPLIEALEDQQRMFVVGPHFSHLAPRSWWNGKCEKFMPPNTGVYWR